MKIMQKMNRQIKIEDEAAEKLLMDGWNEIDASGKVVNTRKTDEGEKTAKLAGKVAALEEENKALRAELEKLKK